MTFEEWWENNYAEVPTEMADRTFGEEVWNASRKDVWGIVFQLVSNRPDYCTHQFIKMLEYERDRDGAGPNMAFGERL